MLASIRGWYQQIRYEQPRGACEACWFLAWPGPFWSEMTMRENDHERFMQRPIDLAVKVPELPIGAVIVHRECGKIVAEGWNNSAINPT